MSAPRVGSELVLMRLKHSCSKPTARELIVKENVTWIASAAANESGTSRSVERDGIGTSPLRLAGAPVDGPVSFLGQETSTANFFFSTMRGVIPSRLGKPLSDSSEP